MLKKGGFNVRVAAFQRDYHQGRMPDCEVKILGKISHGKFLLRIFKIIYALPILRAEIKDCKIIYASGSDMAYMAVIASFGLRKKIVLETGDIRKIQVKSGIKGFFIRKIDAFFLSRCSLLIATAKGFVDEYYRKWLKTNVPSLILENKLEHNYFANTIKPNNNKITIGYFGLLRCHWSWQVLKKLAQENSDKIEIIVAGYPINSIDLFTESKEINSINYLGEYKSPEDLPSLYGKVDIVWACYPFPKKTEWNWKWARTNRYYESLCYKKPMISLENSGDSASVMKYNLGKIIPLEKNIEKVADILSNLNQEEIRTWTENVFKLPENIYVYSKEHIELKNTLLEVLDNK
ncbi:hypothetical protein [Thalassobellus citreus]|uniref:hypothetical protein n=1 Tax=Thalassobellus citreus TaxID=3367752 RepID=UPI0037ACCAB9